MDDGKRSFFKGLLAIGALGMSAKHTSAFAESGAISTSTFNVKDFGAKGDGKTSDTVAIQKALDEAGKISGTVFFPSGVYLCHDLKVSEHTTLLADPQWEYRGVSGAVLKLESEDAKCVLDITRAFGVHVRGLCLQGIAQTEKPVHGIMLYNPEKWSEKEDTIVIDDCKINNFSGNGIYLLRIWLFIVRHCIMKGNRLCGLQLRGWNGFVMDNQFAGNRLDGFGSDEKTSTVMVTANRFEHSRHYGLHLTNSNALNVVGNCFDKNYAAGLYMRNMTTSTVNGNVFRSNGCKIDEVGGEFPASQCVIAECKGVSVCANSASIDKKISQEAFPQFGFSLKDNNTCVFTDNAFNEAYSKDFLNDEGGNKNVIIKNNVFCNK